MKVVVGSGGEDAGSKETHGICWGGVSWWLGFWGCRKEERLKSRVILKSGLHG